MKSGCRNHLAAASLVLLTALGLGGCGAVNTSSGGGLIAAAQGPQLGYVWSESERSLRPILGVPGASQIGQSVVPAGRYLNGLATGKVALLEEASGVDVMALPNGAPLRLQVGAPGSATLQLRLSPSGTAGVIFGRGATALTVISSLTADATVAGGNQVRVVTASGAVQDAAVSDAGVVATLAAQGHGLGLSMQSGDGKSSAVALVSSDGGLTFVGRTDDVLVADGGANTLSLVQSASTAPAVSVVATGGLLKAPAAVGASLSGRWAVVANAGEASVVRVDLTGQTVPQKLACGCQPTVAAGLADDGYFRVTGLVRGAAANEPTWLVDARAAMPRMLFIPAIATSTGTKAASVKTAVAAPSGSATVKLEVRR